MTTKEYRPSSPTYYRRHVILRLSSTHYDVWGPSHKDITSRTPSRKYLGHFVTVKTAKQHIDSRLAGLIR